MDAFGLKLLADKLSAQKLEDSRLTTPHCKSVDFCQPQRFEAVTLDTANKVNWNQENSERTVTVLQSNRNLAPESSFHPSYSLPLSAISLNQNDRRLPISPSTGNMFLLEKSSKGVVSFACLALNLDPIPLNGGHGRPRLIRDLEDSMSLEEDLEDLEDPQYFEEDLKELEDPPDFEEDFKDLEDRDWIDVETGSPSNVLDEEVSSLLMGSRSSGARDPGCVCLLRTGSGGGSEENAKGVLSKSRHRCHRRMRNSSCLSQNSVMQRPSLDFDKMQKTCFGHRHIQNGVKGPRLVRIRGLRRFSSVASQRHPVNQSTSVTLDPSAFTFRSLSLRHEFKIATSSDRPSRAF